MEACVINTYTSYQLVTRALAKSLIRVEKQPMVQRETDYYLANIGKVKSVDEFVNNPRLFNYAMKAHGLEDMAYAKAFMIKALKEGVSDPSAFANQLNDKRYAEFVSSFNFAALGEDATTFNLANQGTTQRYLGRVTPISGTPHPADVQETAWYSQNIGSVKSIDQFLGNGSERLLTYALTAFGLEDSLSDKTLLRSMLEGGIEDDDSPANQHEDENWAQFVRAFDFVRLGDRATTYNPAQEPSVVKFMRQKLEEDAGQQNEGVRLALYFERKASTITNAYQILADTALAAVVRTVLNLPPSIAQLDVDKQAKLIESRIDLEDFQDPAKLEKFMTRFTSMWEVNNPSSPVQSSIITLFQPVEYGISTDALMAIASLKR